MRRDFTRPLLDLLGLPIGNPPLTFGGLAVEALNTPAPPESNPTRDQKLKRFRLAVRVIEGKGPIDVTADECALLMAAIDSMAYSPLVVGRFDSFLNTDPEVPTSGAEADHLRGDESGSQ